MSFSSEVNNHLAQYRKRLQFVARDATQRVVNEAQRNTAKGGRMRVDTGFLRASIQAKTGSMPSGPSTNETGRIYSGDQQADGLPIAAALIRWQPAREPLYIGWTANYARWREYQDGFMRGAAERWQEFVRRSVRLAKEKNL